MSIFGNTIQPASTQNSLLKPPQPAGSLFGGVSAFGATPAATTNQPATTGTSSLFGGAAGTQQTQTSSLFGNPAGQSTGTQFQQPATGTNIFGTSPAQPATTTPSLFGAAQNTQTAAPTSGLFGPPQTAPQNPFSAPSQPSTSLFGASTQTPPAATSFGAPSQPAAGPSLFGAAAQPAQSSLFGKPPGATSLFGQPPQAAGGFLSTTNQQQQQPKPNIFGQSTGNSLFGTSTSNNALSTSALGGGNPLGSFGAQPASNSLLASKGPAQQQVDVYVQFAKLQEKIESIANAWNPASPDCRFQRCFYNLVDPGQVSMYGRPANVTNSALWQKAVRENPDPSCLVPVFAIGYDDLRDRVEAQSQQAAAQQEKLKDIQSRLSELTVRHTTSTTPRLARFASAQIQLTLRLLSFIQHLHLLIPAVRSSSIRPEEEELRKKLEVIEQQLLGGGGRLRGKLGELWAIVGAVRARAGAQSPSNDWKVVDEEGLAQITQILTEQQAGLAHLTKILKKDMKDLSIIMGTNPKGISEEPIEVDSFLGSSNQRASVLR